jgi:hypothetical protein
MTQSLAILSSFGRPSHDPNRFPHTVTVPQSKDAMISHMRRLDGFWIIIIS